jgi:hypothetical protein
MLNLPPRFGVGDAVRFIGTDVPYVVTEYDPESIEYRVQCGDDSVSSQWASEIYFELINRLGLLRTIKTRPGAI